MSQNDLSDSIFEVCVFPLKDIVFYPKTSIPLNIFEPRYIKMVKDAVKNNMPIALCQKPARKDGVDRFMKTIAGTGDPQILQENEDGSMIIILKGLAKVALLEVVSEKPYIKCRAFQISEQSEVNEENQFRLNRFRKYFKTWAEKNLEDAFERSQFLKSLKDDQQLIESMATFFIEDKKDRQNLLEEDDINRRIETLSELIPRAFDSLQSTAKTR